MERHVAGAGIDEIADQAIHRLDHQVAVDRRGDAVLAQRLAHHRPHRQVGHVMVVHDIEMDDVGPRRQHVLDLLPQTGEVGGENGGCDLEVVHERILMQAGRWRSF